jgi:hypothetical protein
MEFLWDAPEFIQAGFHVGRYITATVDAEAEHANAQHLYSNLESTAEQIQVTILVPLYLPFLL